MNSPINSKINWTSAIMALIGVAVTMGWVPPEIKEQVTEVALIAGPVLVGVFRTWFTGSKA